MLCCGVMGEEEIDANSWFLLFSLGNKEVLLTDIENKEWGEQIE